MLFRSWLARSFSARTLKKHYSRTRLQLERLESREVPAVTLNAINDQSFPAGKDLLVPLTGADDLGQAITYTASSSNASVTLSVVAGGPTLDINVSGTKGDGTSFQGDLIIRLFDTVAPTAVNRIQDLVGNQFYDLLTFHRVIDGFMAQGGSVNGDGTGDSGLGKFDDEFDAHTTFNSSGLFALANAGDDTNDTQFFITDIGLNLAQMPQFLNFNYTILGQLIGGFDIYNDIKGTKVEAQSAFNPEVSKPVNPITINSAAFISDNHDSVLRVSAPAGFTGLSKITVTGATPADGSANLSFNVTAAADTVNEPPFLGAIPNLTTTAGTAVTFNLPATDLESDSLTFVINDPNNFGSNPANVTVSIDQANHRATVTPNAGFTGTVDLLVGVRDQTDRSGGAGIDSRSNFDTQVINLTVNSGIDLNASSDTGFFNDDNYTGDTTPTFSILAPTGMTVVLFVNGAGSFAAPESSTPGAYTVTLPAGTLQLGANSIAGTVTDPNAPLQPPTNLSPFTVTFAPGLQSVYVVPGTPGSSQSLTSSLISTESSFHNEVGYYVVDDLAGHIGALAPGDAGWAQAAINAKHVLVTTTQTKGATTNVSVLGGQILGYYLIQDNTSTEFLAKNPTNSKTVAPVAFFSFTAANPDGVNHMQSVGDDSGGRAVFSWEDLTGGGDSDYNDIVLGMQLAATTAPQDQVLKSPVGPTRDVTATFQLQPAVLSKLNSAPTTKTTSPGEVGYFIVDDISGAIGALHPGDAGYAKAALTARHFLFATGDAAFTQKSATIPGGSFFGFYLVPNGTAANVLTNNPNNASNGSPVALFSFSAANPDSATVHFRSFSPEQVTQPAPSDTQPIRIHGTSKLSGTSSDFDDLMFTLAFSGNQNPIPPANSPPVINSLGLAPNPAGTNNLVTATVAASDVDGDPVTFTYVWKVAGVVKKTTSATSSTTDSFDLSVAGNGDTGELVSVEVTPSDGTDSGAMVSTSLTVGNTAPAISSLTLAPNPPHTNEVLTATVAASDADGDAVTFTYVWKVDGVAKQTTSATSATTDAFDLSAAGNGDHGQVVSVEVTPSDGANTGTMDSKSVTVANTPPTVTAVTLSPNPPSTNNILVATVAGGSDTDGDALTFTYVWKVDGVTKQTTTNSSSATDSFDLTVAGNGDHGQVVSVEVTVGDGVDLGNTVSASATVSNTAPAVNSVILTPNPPHTNDIVTATTAPSDADGDTVSLTYVWKVDGVIKKTTTTTATADTLDLSVAGNGDVNQVISVEVTPNDGTIDGALDTSSVTVANSAPVVDTLTLAPNPPGTDDTLTATVAATDADGNTVNLTYVWKVDGAVVKTTSATTALTDTLDLSVAGNGNSGQVVSVEVTPDDGTTVGSLVSASVTVG
jgi:cyclophilin family peptidyl-prolyl cis-trans isomerase/uncharacterized lipoprotein YehR (DUF1307 family)